jgi:hypothetical protein
VQLVATRAWQPHRHRRFFTVHWLCSPPIKWWVLYWMWCSGHDQPIRQRPSSLRTSLLAAATASIVSALARA